MQRPKENPRPGQFDWWLRLHPLAQILSTVAIMLVAGGIAWAQQQARIDALEKEQRTTTARVTEMQSSLHAVATKQAVIAAELKNESARAGEFRDDVKADLSRILQRLATNGGGR